MKLTEKSIQDYNIFKIAAFLGANYKFPFPTDILLTIASSVYDSLKNSPYANAPAGLNIFAELQMGDANDISAITMDISMQKLEYENFDFINILSISAKK